MSHYGPLVKLPQVIQNAAAANGNGTLLNTLGLSGLSVTINPTVAATAIINFEGSEDGTNFVPILAVNAGSTTTGTIVTNPSILSIWFLACNGLQYFRARISNYSAGTITITATPVEGPVDVFGIAAANNPVSPGSPRTILTAVGNVAANTAIIAAVPSNRIKVQYCKLRTAYSAAILNPILTDGNGGATLWDDHMQAIANTLFGSNEGVTAPSYLFGTTAGNALYLNPGGQTVYYDISYWSTDAS